jgi:phospholipase A2
VQAVTNFYRNGQDLWFTRAEGKLKIQPTFLNAQFPGAYLEYAARRGLQTWPRGARWPKVLRPSTGESESSAQHVADTASEANQRIASTKEADVVEQASHQRASQAPMEGTITTNRTALTDSVPGSAQSPPEKQSGPQTETAPDDEPENDVKPSSAYVWIGSSTDTGPSRADNLREEDLASRDGIGIVYVSITSPIPLSMCGSLSPFA